MTPEEIALVEATLDRLDGRLGEVSAAFYARLFAAHPDVQVLFTHRLEDQEAKFARQLDEIVRAIRDVPSLLDRAAALGSRHDAYGVRAGDYARAVDPLIASLAEAVGADWTDEAEQAWRRAYALVAEAMLQGVGSEALR